MKKVRHVLGISGGKDSAALAIYMKDNYPDLDIEYYTSDTGKELGATYKLIDHLEVYLGKKITRLQAFDGSHKNPFDHKLKTLGGFLPSPVNRWCTKSLKLDTFERFVGNDPVISYVGIRGDEDREGYISTKSNIQSIFPFRQNIWSEDVINKVLIETNRIKVCEIYDRLIPASNGDYFREILCTPLTINFNQKQKLNSLLRTNTKLFNRLVFEFLKTTSYPLAAEQNFSLVDDDRVLKIDDIFTILERSGVGIPEYYNKIEFQVNGKKGSYCRSRSGCYFCFYQQKIEWVWLLEQHPELFNQAKEYERGDYTWNQDETLEELSRPERVRQIKEDYLARQSRSDNSNSSFMIDNILDAEEEGCASCFI
ncbi:phosphoadenosine phosphosulfate reductase family protein [Desertivirga brevis]|uniref:phosphoadenosine phosphosulfate reductase family protein n=1 Tax=Desertivirga brevis TaxID=2810310 RepID=UPI001A979BCC|nr:phosphoadenosine phosphosulfate reductase family protein [Pedobacter sp. SYSU D00873]